ncbi:basic proline-rich protein-like [Coffea eugenioides]|uniref:basic proline-rich protein-like n=1 Tax=Coffea eugenioides TaxID=49369 RepID=UPI000F611537|nr:basic proline-rich protein-like [Coffea eugenioides]
MRSSAAAAAAFKACLGYLIVAILLSASCVLAAENSEKSFLPRKVYFVHGIKNSYPDKTHWSGFYWDPFPGFKWPPFPGFNWPPSSPPSGSSPPFPWPFPGFKWPPIPSPSFPPPLAKPTSGSSPPFSWPFPGFKWPPIPWPFFGLPDFHRSPTQSPHASPPLVQPPSESPPVGGASISPSPSPPPPYQGETPPPSPWSGWDEPTFTQSTPDWLIWEDSTTRSI